MNEFDMTRTGALPINRRNKHVTYNILPQEEISNESTEEKITNDQNEEKKKTNLFKSRIIETDIHSSLILQIIIFYQYYFTLMSFFIQFTSVSYKIWIFNPDNFNIIKIILCILWVIIDLERLERGFKGNIEENFPALASFIIIGIIFCLPLQVSQIMGGKILPIDYSCFGINLIFLFIEIWLSIRNMMKIVRKQSSVYYLRNTSTKIISHDKRILTSKEIEEELFFKFPNL